MSLDDHTFVHVDFKSKFYLDGSEGVSVFRIIINDGDKIVSDVSLLGDAFGVTRFKWHQCGHMEDH